jgi:hypothetical protein
MGHQHHVPATEWRGLEILSALCVLYEPVELYDRGAVPWNSTTWQLIPGCASKLVESQMVYWMDGTCDFHHSPQAELDRPDPSFLGEGK